MSAWTTVRLSRVRRGQFPARAHIAALRSSVVASRPRRRQLAGVLGRPGRELQDRAQRTGIGVPVWPDHRSSASTSPGTSR